MERPEDPLVVNDVAGHPPIQEEVAEQSGHQRSALSSPYMGHSSIKVTFDLYGHLMPGAEEEAAGLLDSFLAAQRERAEDQARSAAVAV